MAIVGVKGLIVCRHNIPSNGLPQWRHARQVKI